MRTIQFTANADYLCLPKPISYKKGEVHELRDDLAARWIRRGVAVYRDPVAPIQEAPESEVKAIADFFGVANIDEAALKAAFETAEETGDPDPLALGELSKCVLDPPPAVESEFISEGTHTPEPAVSGSFLAQYLPPQRRGRPRK